ncbi:Uncharacterized protein APZ42_010346, partial [Daphnia magna]
KGKRNCCSFSSILCIVQIHGFGLESKRSSIFAVISRNWIFKNSKLLLV